MRRNLDCSSQVFQTLYHVVIEIVRRKKIITNATHNNIIDNFMAINANGNVLVCVRVWLMVHTLWPHIKIMKHLMETNLFPNKKKT